MASGTLKEYLVGLGFKVDETSYKRFNNSLGVTNKNVVELGAGIIAVTAGINAMVLAVTRQMEAMYYASQRSGATVTNLRAVEAGFAQIGMSAEAARGIIENLGRNLRTQPGLNGMLKSMGIDPEGKDTAEIMLRLVGELRKMGPVGSLGHATATRIGSMFGIDPDTLANMINNYEALTKAVSDNRDLQKKAGTDTSREQFRDLSREIEKLVSIFDVLNEQIAQTFVPYLKAAVIWSQQLLTAFIELNKETNGWAGAIGAVVAGLGAWKIAQTALRAVLPGAAGAAGAGAAAAGGGVAASVLRLTAGAVRRFSPIGAFLGAMSPGSAGQGEDARMAALKAWAARNPGRDPSEFVYGVSNDNQSAPLGIRNNNPGNLRSWGGAEQRGGFAAFPTPLAGLSAMAQQLLLYAQRGVSTISGIVNKWAPASDGNNVGAYIGNLVNQTGFGADQQLNLSNPEVLEKLMKGMINQENGGQPYDDQMIRSAIAGRLMQRADALGAGGSGSRAGGATINQTNNINVTGGSANEIAAGIGAQLERVNGDLIRNTAANQR